MVCFVNQVNHSVTIRKNSTIYNPGTLSDAFYCRDRFSTRQQFSLFLQPFSPTLNKTERAAMSFISLKGLVQNSKLLSGLLTPASKIYANAAAYRQIGNYPILNYYLFLILQ